ncbi:sigma-54 dependent transcriptional regulator [bacterium]|nr:sigma-54 dependent transcriptional regulator [bacterium]
MASSREGILVVDDDVAVAEAHAALVDQCGYMALVENDPTKVSKRLADDLAIRLVILDIRMPKMSGLEVLAELRTKHPSIGVIMATVVNDISHAVEAIKSGAFNYLLKPVQQETLQKVLTTYNSLRPRCFRNDPRFSNFLTVEPCMEPIFEKILSFATENVPVLVHGETGTGKEIVANLIHTISDRIEKPFVPVNVAAIANSLFESELFGHVKGAFTGAISDKAGFFDAAKGGTLFLDEIGELELEHQAKLLRVLQENEYRRVGSSAVQRADVRYVFATNRDLKADVAAGKFREDLYYRVAGHSVSLPSLRERPDDIDYLSHHFLGKYASQYGRHVEGFTSEAIDLLKRYPFRGNVRELEGIISSSVLLEESIFIQPSSLPIEVSQHSPISSPTEFHSLDLKGLRRKAILRVLEECDGNRTQAAKKLGIARGSLSRILKRFEQEDAKM